MCFLFFTMEQVNTVQKILTEKYSGKLLNYSSYNNQHNVKSFGCKTNYIISFL